jgi:hypothetical protein
MNTKDLEVALDRTCFGFNAYWHDDEFIVGYFVLSERSHGKWWPVGKWCVYNFRCVERVNRWCFDSESKACENLLKRVQRVSDLRRKYRKMTKNDLKVELDLAGVSPRAYDLENMKYADSRVVLRHEAGDNWLVYSDDRGKKLDLIGFDSESEACEHLLDRVLSLIEKFGANQWG